MTDTSVAARRLDRVVLVQAHCAALDLAAALCLGVAATRLDRVPGAWQTWRSTLFAAAALAAAAALLPWLTARFTVRWQRRLVGTAIVLGTIGVFGATWAVDLLAVLGVQLLVAAVVLAELGGQRRAVWWFWVTAVVLIVAVAGYHVLVDLQPRPE